MVKKGRVIKNRVMKQEWMAMKRGLANAQSDLAVALLAEDWLLAYILQDSIDRKMLNMRLNPRFKYHGTKRRIVAGLF